MCERLGFPPADHFVAVTQMGTIDFDDGQRPTLERVRDLYWACVREGLKPSKHLRVAATGWRGDRGF